jgi:hypothetical protein
VFLFTTNLYYDDRVATDRPGRHMYMQLRVYTAEDVPNELESWVRVAGRRQLAVLLHWHMCHFADDAASLLEFEGGRSSPTSSSSR